MLVKNISGEIQYGVDTGLYGIGEIDVAVDAIFQTEDDKGNYLITTMDTLFIAATDVGGGSSECIFDGVYQTPVGAVSGTTCQEWIDLHFPSQPPTMSLRGSPAFGLYEIGSLLSSPLVEGSGMLGSNPHGSLSQLNIPTTSFSELNPIPGSRYGSNDVDLLVVDGVSKTYSGTLQDSEGRLATSSGSYIGAYPYYGTSISIITLTKQILKLNNSTMFGVDNVAETGGNKYKVDIVETTSITGIEFFNTISGNWERMGGSKSNSLLLRTTTVITHVVQGNSISYKRYTHNGIDGGALQTRFYTN